MQARDALATVIDGCIKDGRDIPSPSARRRTADRGWRDGWTGSGRCGVGVATPSLFRVTRRRTERWPPEAPDSRRSEKADLAAVVRPDDRSTPVGTGSDVHEPASVAATRSEIEVIVGACSSCSSRKESRSTEIDSIEPPQPHRFSGTWRLPKVLRKSGEPRRNRTFQPSERICVCEPGVCVQDLPRH
jgi:hypothetical protein